MALQVWLPLNGDIHNQGLDDKTVISRAVEFGTGKVTQKGAKFNGDCNQYIHIGDTEDFQYDEFTWSVWIYPTSSSTSGFIISHGRDYLKHGFNILVKTNGALVIYSKKVWDNITTLVVNTWYHVAVTLKGNVVKAYLNGNFVKSWTSDTKLDYDESQGLTIGKMSYNYSSTSSYFPFSGIINDVRIYDNALSEREIKELSKGICLHYPLGNIDGKIGGRNLILNGKGNEKVGFFRYFHTVTDEYGELTFTSKKQYRNISISDGFKISIRDYPIGQKYIWSYDIMYTAWNFPTGSNRNEFWMGQRYTNAPSGETATGTWRGVTKHNLPVVGVNGCELNKWYHVERIVTIPEQASSNVRDVASIQFYNSNADVEASFTMRIKNVKLEVGGQATPYTPAPEDYPAMYDNVIYDSSGYGNNGNVSDSTCPTWSDNSPRYKGCYHFEKKHYLTIQSPFGTNSVSEFTINLWIKQTTTTGGIPTFLSSGGYGGRGLWLAMNTESNGQWGYKGDVSPNYARGDSTLSLNTWYMFTYVFKDGKVTWYRDGISKKTTTYTSSTSPFANTITLGDNYTGTSWDTSFVGDISDLRIYSTALSDSNILDLYQTSGTIDSNGNLLINEVIEE